MNKQWIAALVAVAMTIGSSTAEAGLFDHLHGDSCDVACDSLISCEGLGCDSGCDSCGSDCPVLGMISLRKSDHCFDDFISPMSNFVHFEDPRTLTELRPIFIHHRLPNRMGTLGIDGGEIQLFAVQARVALTERLSLIAVKDGYIWAQNEGPISGLLNDGWADVSAGLKYNWLRDVQRGTLASSGFHYEIPLGDDRALQSVADGEFHIFTSIAQRWFDGNAHYMTTIGWRLPVDDGLQTESLHWSNHLDVRLTERFYAVTELVWWHWLDDADASPLPLGVGGQDAFNLPANNVVGNDLLTQSVGVKYKPSGNFELGFAYEFPLTKFNDVLDDRFQVDMIFRY